jgi:hypothetical protein
LPEKEVRRFNYEVERETQVDENGVSNLKLRILKWFYRTLFNLMNTCSIQRLKVRLGVVFILWDSPTALKDFKFYQLQCNLYKSFDAPGRGYPLNVLLEIMVFETDWIEVQCEMRCRERFRLLMEGSD